MKKITLIIIAIIIPSIINAGVCDEVLSADSPTDALTLSEISLNITDNGVNNYKILNSLTTNGRTLDKIVTAHMIDFKYNKNNRNAIYENGTRGHQSNAGSIFLAKFKDISNNYNLNDFLATESTDNGDTIDYIYSNSIASSGDRFIFLSKRQEPNSSLNLHYIQALDSTLSVMGNKRLVEGADYLDIGLNINAFNSDLPLFVAIYPLTGLVPTGTQIYGLRITKHNTNTSNIEDGVDGKVFLFIDKTTLPCRVIANNDDFTSTQIEAGDFTPSVFLDNGHGTDMADETVVATNSNIDDTMYITQSDGLSATTITPNGEIKIPANTQSGTYRPTYKICLEKDVSYCDEGISKIVINNKPQETNDTATTDQGLTIDIDVIANDTHVDVGEQLSLSAVDQPVNGTTSIVNGKVRYTPNNGFSGVDLFTYDVKDSKGNISKGTVSITVNPAPNITIDDSTITEGGQLSFVFQLSRMYGSDMKLTLKITDNTTDSDDYDSSTTLSLIILANELTGTFRLITLDDTKIEPQSENFTLSIISVDTEIGDITDTGTGYILDNDDLIHATDDNYNLYENISQNLLILSNDYYETPADKVKLVSFTTPTNGTVILRENNVSDTEDDSIYYTPDFGYVGSDSFKYIIEDSNGNQKSADVRIDIEGKPDINISDFTVIEGGDLEFEIKLSHTISKDAKIVLLATNNTTTNDDYNQTTIMEYTVVNGTFGGNFILSTVDDGIDELDTESLTISIVSVPDYVGDTNDTAKGFILDNDESPIINDDHSETDQGLPIVIDVLLNDVHPTAGETLSILSTSGASNGRTDIINDEVVYTPDPNFVGSDSFTYTVTDLSGNTGSADVNITIYSAPDVSISDTTATEGGDLSFTISLTKPYGAEITLNLKIQNNTTDNSDHEGSTIPLVIKIPKNHVSGVFLLPTIADGIDELNSENLTLSIVSSQTEIGDITDTGIGYILDNDSSPIANNDIVNVDQGLVANISVLANDSHPTAGEELKIVSISGGSHGSISINGNGTTTTTDDKITYTPNPSFVGEDNFSYTVSDLKGNTATADVNVSVLSAPNIFIEDAKTIEGGQLTFNFTTSHPYGEDIVLKLKIMNNTTNNDDHHGESTLLELTIPKGKLLSKFRLMTINDKIDENQTESLTLSIISSSTAIGDISDTANGYIIDNDSAIVAIDDNVTGISFRKTSINVLSNDIIGNEGVDKSSLKIINNGLYINRLELPKIGVWEVNARSKIISFTPSLNYNGDPLAILYSIKDKGGNEGIAKIRLNHNPIALDDIVILNGNKTTIKVFTNDVPSGTDINKDSLKFIKNNKEVSSITIKDKGKFTIKNGVVIFIAVNGFTGIVSTEYIYREVDGSKSNRAKIEIDSVLLKDDFKKTKKLVGTEIEINISENDDSRIQQSSLYFVNGKTKKLNKFGKLDKDTLNSSSLFISGQGTWNISSGIATFTPDAKFMGDPSPVKYTAKYKGVELSPVSITLKYNDIPPKALDNLGVPITSFNVLTIDVLDNDTFGGYGAGEVLFKYTSPLHGVLSIDKNNTPNDASDDKLIYKPNGVDYVGNDVFSYTITDSRGRTSTAKVTLNITCSSSQDEDSVGISKYLYLFIFSIFILIGIRKEDN